MQENTQNTNKKSKVNDNLQFELPAVGIFESIFLFVINAYQLDMLTERGSYECESADEKLFREYGIRHDKWLAKSIHLVFCIENNSNLIDSAQHKSHSNPQKRNGISCEIFSNRIANPSFISIDWRDTIYSAREC